MSKLHLIGIFHTKHTDEYSHCAFTGKAKRFPKMMRAQGWDVITYANAGSDEDVTMLQDSEFDEYFGGYKVTDFFGDRATVGAPGHQAFEKRLISALRDNVSDHDIICHPFGHAHSRVVSEFPNCYHVETGIGYPTLMDGTFKVFESYAWMHYHHGKAGRGGKNYEWVVPNYFDLDEWEPSYSSGEYLAFLGRICKVKGMNTIKAIADHSPYPIVLHGQGDPTPWRHDNIVYKGPISGSARSDFLRNAVATLMPSEFVEPFGGSGVESMLCGTPVLSVNYGAMTETVLENITGCRCHTLQDWLDGIETASKMSRYVVAKVSRDRYSLEACGKKYSRIFETILQLRGKGWYTLKKC